MARVDVERALAMAIDAESRVGLLWWPGADMAPVAVRRWSSFARRHPRARHPSTDDRGLDLAKGLQAHFEPGTPYTPLSEWLHLAGLLARVLAGEAAEPGAAADGGAWFVSGTPSSPVPRRCWAVSFAIKEELTLDALISVAWNLGIR
jgi:hypothetical protein